MFRPRLSMTMVTQIIGSAPFLYEGDFSRGIELAREYGYDCVEIHVADPDELNISGLIPVLSHNNIAVSALGTGRAYVNDGLSLIDDREDIRQKALSRLLKFIDSAGVLNSLVIVGCIRGNIPDKSLYDKYLERLGNAMKYADEYASEKGVTIAIEPINRYENNYLCSTYEISDFIKQFDLKNVKILVDTFHMNIEEKNILKTFEDNISNIAYIHFADSNRWFPGNGHIDFISILKILKDLGYKGDISAECLPLPGKEAGAKGWISAMKKMLEAL